AQLFNSDEALSIGLVDESVELDQVMPRAIAHLNKLLQVHPLVYSQTKKYLRKELWNIVNVDLDQAADEFISFSQQPELIALVEQFAAMLGIKKA
ncbi:MAG: hypothetical protein KTR24_15690, partial [Saprospiraceae bacterium]|nr:hypothetical protein [Saprospiraceae bacterium]